MYLTPPFQALGSAMLQLHGGWRAQTPVAEQHGLLSWYTPSHAPGHAMQYLPSSRRPARQLEGGQQGARRASPMPGPTTDHSTAA